MMKNKLLIGILGVVCSFTAPAMAADLIRVDGSSTVFPITEATSEEFQKEMASVKVMVGISGTGGGFKRFCRGETDISDASRPIKAKEIQACKESGIEFIEIPIAYDGLAVVVNPANTWASTLTVDDLKKMWDAVAQDKVTNWNQVRSDFPNKELHLFGPGTDSGTFDYFTEAINGKQGQSRGDYTASEDDNVLVEGVGSDEGALGYFGLAYYEQNKDRLKVVAIDDNKSSDGEGGIIPTSETVRDGTYQPLARPLFIYINSKSATIPKVKKFVEFYLAHAAELSKEVGYIALPDDAYDAAKDRFAKGIKGSVFSTLTSQVGVKISDLLRMEK